jgi:hypothetical protein
MKKTFLAIALAAAVASVGFAQTAPATPKTVTVAGKKRHKKPGKRGNKKNAAVAPVAGSPLAA